MKKLIALVLVLVTLLSLAACGSSLDVDDIVKNLEDEGYDVEVMDDKDEIKEEVDMEEMEEEMGVSVSLPIALIEAEDGDYAIAIIVFEDADDAEEFYDAYVDMAKAWGADVDEMGIGIEDNCVYMGDEEAAEIAFGK